MAYEVTVPVKEYVQEYLAAQHGDGPLYLPETSALSSLLRDDSDKRKFTPAQYKPELYCESVQIVSEIRIPVPGAAQIIKFNHFIELQIKVMVYFRVNTSPKKLREVVLDVMAENNFPPEKFNTLKSFMYDLNREKNAYGTSQIA